MLGHELTVADTNEPGVHVDYLAICDANNLEPLTHVQGAVVLLGAIRLGKVRLIDNRLVHCPRKFR